MVTYIYIYIYKAVHFRSRVQHTATFSAATLPPPGGEGPELSPSSILPPLTSHYTFITARKNSERVSKIFLFISPFQNCVIPKLRNL